MGGILSRSNFEIVVFSTFISCFLVFFFKDSSSFILGQSAASSLAFFLIRDHLNWPEPSLKINLKEVLVVIKLTFDYHATLQVNCNDRGIQHFTLAVVQETHRDVLFYMISRQNVKNLVPYILTQTLVGYTIWWGNPTKKNFVVEKSHQSGEMMVVQGVQMVVMGSLFWVREILRKNEELQG